MHRVYPKGEAPDANTGVMIDPPDPRLKELPDVCKLRLLSSA